MTTQPLNIQDLTWQQAVLNELKELEASGVKLPMTPEEIVRIEAQGDLVDLDTGEVIQAGASIRVRITELVHVGANN